MTAGTSPQLMVTTMCLVRSWGGTCWRCFFCVCVWVGGEGGGEVSVLGVGLVVRQVCTPGRFLTCDRRKPRFPRTIITSFSWPHPPAQTMRRWVGLDTRTPCACLCSTAACSTSGMEGAGVWVGEWMRGRTGSARVSARPVERCRAARFFCDPPSIVPLPLTPQADDCIHGPDQQGHPPRGG